jgi:hypothetical protein
MQQKASLTLNIYEIVGFHCREDWCCGILGSEAVTNSVDLSPQTNYTDWATAADRRIVVPTFEDRGVSRGQCVGSLTVVNLSFLDRSRYFFLSSSSFILTKLSGPRSRPTATQKIW